VTSAEIAIHDGRGERDIVDGWIAVASDVIKLANVIAETDFVPEDLRGNAPAVAASILAGRELGIGPMTSLRHVQVVKGTPSLSAEFKRARVLGAGHEFDIVELTTQRCRVSGRRRGSTKPPLEVTFTMDDARRAGLVKSKGAWETRPRRMLFARAGSELCDFMFADVVNGLPTAELLSDGGDGYEGYDEPPADKKPQKTARRQAPNGKAEKAPKVAAAGDQPPLPGEEEGHGEATDPHYPGTVTAPQLTKLAAVFTRMGFADEERDQRLAAESKIVRRTIETSSELSFDEAKLLIDTLERCGTRDNLIALLAAGETP
jgi:hypothetical protein